MKIFNLLIILCWFIFFLYWFVSSFGIKRSTRQSFAWGGSLIRIGAFIIIFLALRSQTIDSYIQNSISKPNPTLATIGVIVCACGIGFAIWARAHLGKNWGMPMSVKEAPDLITSGPYAYVRHPIYTGVLFGILGSTFVAGLYWLIIFIVSSIYFFYSARIEEKRLLRQFGEQYQAYKNRTKMLIPFIF